MRKGFVNLCIALMKEALGGDLMTKWNVFRFCSCTPLSPVAPLVAWSASPALALRLAVTWGTQLLGSSILI